MGKARLVVEDGESVRDKQPDQTLDDSLSETRPLPNPDFESSDSEVEQDDPFLDRLKKVNNRAYIKPILKVTRPVFNNNKPRVFTYIQVWTWSYQLNYCFGAL